MVVIFLKVAVLKKDRPNKPPLSIFLKMEVSMFYSTFGLGS